MGPDQGGHYRLPIVNELNYQGVTYLLKTCCQMCADAMKKELRENSQLK